MSQTINAALVGYGFAGQTFHAPFLTSTPGLALRWVVSPTTGVDHLDLAHFDAQGVQVICLRGRTAFLDHIHATAEHTLALLLALVRRIPAAVQDVARGAWNRYPFQGTELHGKTVLILGYGRIGRQVLVKAGKDGAVLERGQPGFVLLTGFGQPGEDHVAFLHALGLHPGLQAVHAVLQLRVGEGAAPVDQRWLVGVQAIRQAGHGARGAQAAEQKARQQAAQGWKGHRNLPKTA